MCQKTKKTDNNVTSYNIKTYTGTWGGGGVPRGGMTRVIPNCKKKRSLTFSVHSPQLRIAQITNDPSSDPKQGIAQTGEIGQYTYIYIYINTDFAGFCYCIFLSF